VLAGDLFNRVVTSQASNSASRTALREWIYASSEDEAYEIYGKEYEFAQRQSTSGHAAVKYVGTGVWDGDMDFAHAYERKIGRQEFGQRFRSAKARHQSGRDSAGESSHSLATDVASNVRDPKSIEAWKACVTQQPTPGLHAFGSRDDSGNPFINVVWSPGPFSGAYPAITIDIVTPSSDVKVEAGTARWPSEAAGVSASRHPTSRRDLPSRSTAI
jgi:hypothetical protein